MNVRDHYNGRFNNTIDNLNALPAFSGTTGARLDMQIYTLPALFAQETLQTIRFTNLQLGNPKGNPFIAAATVEVAAPTIGDINNSGSVDMEDAILALRLLSGINTTTPVYPSSDVDGDAKIGLQDSIYILQKIVGMR